MGRKIIAKCSLLVLFYYIVLVLDNYVALSITGLSIYISRHSVTVAFILGALLWVNFSPIRKVCCNGRWMEVLFNLLPVNALVLLIFSQRNFVFAAFLLIVYIILLVAFCLVLNYDNRREHPVFEAGRYWKVFTRFSVLAFSVCCAIPLFMVTFCYGVSTPEYTSSQSYLSNVIDESDEDPYAANYSLLSCFQKDVWKKYTVQEQTDIIQEFVNFECGILGIPEVAVTVGTLDDYTLGAYDDETDEIYISVEYMDLYSAEETMETLCHETYHAFQYYCINHVDWESELCNTAYCDEIRSWQENSEDYVSPTVSSYNAYVSQPLEASAREYAEEEVERILSYIDQEDGE